MIFLQLLLALYAAGVAVNIGIVFVNKDKMDGGIASVFGVIITSWVGVGVAIGILLDDADRV